MLETGILNQYVLPAANIFEMCEEFVCCHN